MDQEDMLNFDELDNQIQSIIDHSELQSNLKIQLGEIDVLRAMYYKEKEFAIDETVLQKVNDYVFGNSYDIPPTIDFSINLTINDDMLLETHVILPESYPSVPPKVHARSSQLVRIQQDALNCDLDSYLQSLDRGTICIYEGISWLNENVCKYRVKPNKKESSDVETPSAKPSRCLFTRYWIYSHHIYSKDKRRDLLALARTCNVTGFCLSGKPGIICAEGLESDCNEWWQKVRGMSWKRIICKNIEEMPSTLDSFNSLRKFDSFNEINFPNLKTHRAQDSHTNMGDFYRYLVEHNCEHVFKDYFGIEGKSSSQ